LEGSQLVGVLDTSANSLRKSAEKIGPGRRELVATDESPIITKPFLDTIVVQDGEDDRRFANATRTDEGDGIEILDDTNNGLDQIVAAKTSPRWGRRRLAKYARCKHEPLGFS
jgi:hypothetical protein